jgi:hypothetical protein
MTPGYHDLLALARCAVDDLTVATVVDTLHALKNHLLAVRLNVARARTANDPVVVDRMLAEAFEAVDKAIDDVYLLVEAVVADKPG